MESEIHREALLGEGVILNRQNFISNNELSEGKQEHAPSQGPVSPRTPIIQMKMRFHRNKFPKSVELKTLTDPVLTRDSVKRDERDDCSPLAPTALRTRPPRVHLHSAGLLRIAWAFPVHSVGGTFQAWLVWLRGGAWTYL